MWFKHEGKTLWAFGNGRVVLGPLCAGEELIPRCHVEPEEEEDPFGPGLLDRARKAGFDD